MRTLLMAVCVLMVAGVAGAPVLAAGPSETAVFELKYRGLDAPDDPLSYRAYWGWGSSGDRDDPFVQAVRGRVGECTPVYNGSLPNAKWAVVELQDKKPVALYFDADADGKLSEQERFAPASPAGANFGYPYAFITSDFLVRAQDQQEIPFRLLLVGNSHGGTYMWSPCCLLEGQATLAGEPMRLLLYTNGFNGSFTTFGSCSFALVPARQKPDGVISRSPLSSLIRHKGTFYRVKLSGTHAKDQTVRATFEKDTTPTGQVAIELKGKELFKARLLYTRITGTTDPSVHLAMAETLSALPTGRYKLTSGTLGYGVRDDAQWQVAFSDGPDLTIDPVKTGRIELGTPTLSVRAIKEADRYASDVKQQATFPKGTPILLTPQLTGEAGETYGRFSQKTGSSSRLTDLKTHLTIAGPDGKQVVSVDMEYG